VLVKGRIVKGGSPLSPLRESYEIDFRAGTPESRTLFHFLSLRLVRRLSR